MGVTLFDDASLVLIPSGIKASKVYSVKPDDGTGDFTFSRASDATRVNSAGLIEKVRTNLFLQSEAFNTANWTKTNVTLTSGILSPDGTNDAFRVESTGVASMIQAVTMTNGLTYNISLWIKSAGTGKDTLRLVQQTNRFFDVTATNEWVRYDFSFTNTYATGGQNNGITRDALGNAFDVYIYGFQLEAAEAVSDYIPTTTAAVTVGITSNVPRLDYSGGATCPSLLLEPQRTNLAFYSEQFDNAYWSKPLGWTLTPNALVSPDGTANADLITPTNFNNLSRSFTVSTSTTYTPSIYLKRNNTNFSWVSFAFTGGTAISYGYEINWSTFTITLLSGRTPAVSPTFESVGNGWYRISFGCASGNNTSASFQIIPDSRGGVNSLYLWGAQLEVGSFVSSYIPTTTAAVTRLADTASKTGVSSLIGQTEGTLFVEWENKNNDLCNLIETYNASSGIAGTSSILIQKSSNSDFTIRVFDSLGNYTDVFSVTIPLGSNKVALAYQSGSAVLYLNGVSIGSNSRTYVFVSTRDAISFDNRGAYSRSQALLFKTALTNAQLAEITTL